MALFKEHKLSANQLLSFIPEALLEHLSTTTKVDHYSKVLHGKKVFYLLLFAILDNDRLSQRTLEDTFNGSIFKNLFNMDESETVRRSSISERLSKIDSSYFKEIFEFLYDKFSEHYTLGERHGHNLIRVDSTIVSHAASKLKQGIDHGSGKKMIKFSTCFDGILPAGIEVFDQQAYGSEDIALPEAIYKHVKKDPDHSNIYIIDRGLQSTRNMKDFSDRSRGFIARTKENRKFEETKNLMENDRQVDLGELMLLRDSQVNLYTGIAINNKKGNVHFRETKIETPFRLVVARSKAEQQKEYWFLTNNFELSAKQITDYYRRRWDIEVFFRFIKQELHVSHLVSLNKNGIEVMLYMTLIVAILILIYKKANGLGYKTAKRRLTTEIKELAIAIMIILSGGDPGKIFKT